MRVYRLLMQYINSKRISITSTFYVTLLFSLQLLCLGFSNHLAPNTHQAAYEVRFSNTIRIKKNGLLDLYSECGFFRTDHTEIAKTYDWLTPRLPLLPRHVGVEQSQCVRCFNHSLVSLAFDWLTTASFRNAVRFRTLSQYDVQRVFLHAICILLKITWCAHLYKCARHLLGHRLSDKNFEHMLGDRPCQ